MLTNIAAFLEFIKGLKPKDRLTATFGSFGWAGGAIGEIETLLKETGLEIAQPGLGVKYVPDTSDLKNCLKPGLNPILTKLFASHVQPRLSETGSWSAAGRRSKSSSASPRSCRLREKSLAPISWCGPMARWTRTRSSSNEFS